MTLLLFWPSLGTQITTVNGRSLQELLVTVSTVEVGDLADSDRCRTGRRWRKKKVAQKSQALSI